MPASLSQYRLAKPVYESLLGGTVFLTRYGKRDSALCQKPKEYIKFVEDQIDCPVKLISVGPQRHETIYKIVSFTKEIVDFSGLSVEEIQDKLLNLNISITAQEALKIQNEMLCRAHQFQNWFCPYKDQNIVAIKVVGNT